MHTLMLSHTQEMENILNKPERSSVCTDTVSRQ